MMKTFNCGITSILLSFFLTLILSVSASAQYKITGRVVDAETDEPAIFANVMVKNTALGAQTDTAGYYELTLTSLNDSLVVSFVGYNRMAKAVNPTKAVQEINFALRSETQQLNEVVILSGENPAWAILRQVIKNKDANDRKKLAAYEYESYSRIELLLANVSEKMRKQRLIKDIEKSVADLAIERDSTGAPRVPVFVSETLSKLFFRRDPKKIKEVILSSKAEGIGVTDQTVLTEVLGATYSDFNFYQNWVRFLGKDLHSPIADGWQGTYKYILGDTLRRVGERTCYEIRFKPKVKYDLAFTGKVWIDTSTFALAKIDVYVSKDVNLNYIDEVSVSQVFQPIPNTTAWMPGTTQMRVNVAPITANTAGFIANIFLNNRTFLVDKPREESFFDVPIVREDSISTEQKSEAFWAQVRPEPLSKEEQARYAIIDSIKNVPRLKRWTKIARAITTGHVPIVRGIEWGPFINSFALNDVEGLRLQFSFRTNDSLSRRLTFKGYGAYGTKDERPKYGLEAYWTASRQPYVQLSLRKTRDLDQVGVSQSQLANNPLAAQLFGALTRFGRFERPFIKDEWSFYALHEVLKGLTQTATVTTQQFEPLFKFAYRSNPALGTDSPLATRYRMNELQYDMRFAKGEMIVRRNNKRAIRLKKALDWPIFSFRYNFGVAESNDGNTLTYHRFTGSITKSLRVGILGRSEFEVIGGFTPSTAPYPLLFVHQGNPTPVFTQTAFNAMRFFEFTSDRYVSAGLFHDFDGFITNRLPLIRRLNLRSHAYVKALWGDIRPENEAIIPDKNNAGEDVPRFGRLNPNRPYVEVGYGIDNVFKLLRISFVHRITYREKVDALKFGVRATAYLRL